jgi:hypothetical protein
MAFSGCSTILMPSSSAGCVLTAFAGKADIARRFDRARNRAEQAEASALGSAGQHETGLTIAHFNVFPKVQELRDGQTIAASNRSL